MGTQWSKTGTGYLVVQGRLWLPSGKRWEKSTQWSKVGNGYLVVQGLQRVPRDTRYTMGTLWSKVYIGYTSVSIHSECQNSASQWTGEFWSNGVLLILSNQIKERRRKKWYLQLLRFECFLCVCFLVFANNPTVHSGGFIRRRVCGCCCWCL